MDFPTWNLTLIISQVTLYPLFHQNILQESLAYSLLKIQSDFVVQEGRHWQGKRTVSNILLLFSESWWLYTLICFYWSYGESELVEWVWKKRERCKVGLSSSLWAIACHTVVWGLHFWAKTNDQLELHHLHVRATFISTPLKIPWCIRMSQHEQVS